MRILFVSNLFPDADQLYRGLDNRIILHHLRARGHDVRVVSPRPCLGRKRFAARADDSALRPLFLPVGYVPKLGGWFNHRLMARALTPVLGQIAADWRWDVVLGSWLFPDGWAVCRAARRARGEAPVVLIAQGSDAHHYLKSPPRKRAILQACEAAARVITRSRSLAALLTGHGVEAGRLWAVHNGVDVGVFHRGDREEARARLGMAGDEIWLLFVGNLLPVKDPEFLLRAFARLAREPGRRLRLALAGKGPMRPQLEALARELGVAEQTRFLGPLDAEGIACWMRASALLVMSSRNEGLPNVILEAQACGLPVVSTRVGGIAEVITDKTAGLLTPPGDMDAWVEAVEVLLKASPDRDALASRGMERTWQATAAAYEEILELALASAAEPWLRTTNG